MQKDKIKAHTGIDWAKPISSAFVWSVATGVPCVYSNTRSIPFREQRLCSINHIFRIKAWCQQNLFVQLFNQLDWTPLSSMCLLVAVSCCWSCLFWVLIPRDNTYQLPPRCRPCTRVCLHSFCQSRVSIFHTLSATKSFSLTPWAFSRRNLLKALFPLTQTELRKLVQKCSFLRMWPTCTKGNTRFFCEAKCKQSAGMIKRRSTGIMQSGRSLGDGPSRLRLNGIYSPLR